MNMAHSFCRFTPRAWCSGVCLALAGVCTAWATPDAAAINLLYDYYKGVGGRQNLENLRSLKVVGKVEATVRGKDGKPVQVSQDFELWIANPFLVRFNIRADETELARGWDGYFSWIATPGSGSKREAKPSPSEMHEGLLYLACMFDNLYALEQKGFEFSSQPDETVDGVVCAALAFKQPKQNIRGVYLFDKKTFLPKYLRVYPHSGENESRGLAVFSDWSEKDGVWFPAKVDYTENDIHQFTLSVSAVRQNVLAPSFYFVMPGKEVNWLQNERQRKKQAVDAAQK